MFLIVIIYLLKSLVLVYRFYGRIAENPSCHDTDTLDAIKANGAGLAKVSGERIWMELSLILAGNFWGELMEFILKCDLGPHIGKETRPNSL